jgi:excinuclease ABC subunit C
LIPVVSKARFDKKFGADFLSSVPPSPGVYVFRDRDDAMLYVGKSSDLRRRLRSYRNASRRKVHRKMLYLVRDATSIEIRQTKTEQEALLLENELIRTERPPHNVEGAFSFLYPAIGLIRMDKRTQLVFTAHPERWSEHGDLRLFGVFRSRLRTREAFDALVDLLLRLGHREPRSRFPETPKDKGSRLVGIRRLDCHLVDALEGFLSGSSREFLTQLTRRLLERADARHEAAQVEETLHTLADFYTVDARKLFEARQKVGWGSSFVPQKERDALFIKAKVDA